MLRFELRTVKQIAKLGALAITTVLLTATSYVPECTNSVAPVAFRASGSCGPGGLIVVGGTGSVWMANAAAVGLPTLGTDPFVTRSYVGASCPFRPAENDWSFVWQMCANRTADASTDGESGDAVISTSDGGGGSGGGGGSAGDAGGDGGEGLSCLRECRARAAGAGELLFTCVDSVGAVLCESRLKKVEVP